MKLTVFLVAYLDTGSPDVLGAFGMVLRELRQRKRWSQEALAFEARMDRTYISLLELGRNSASVSMVFKLCKALEITPSEFMKLVEERVAALPRRPDLA